MRDCFRLCNLDTREYCVVVLCDWFSYGDSVLFGFISICSVGDCHNGIIWDFMCDCIVVSSHISWYCCFYNR